MIMKILFYSLVVVCVCAVAGCGSSEGAAKKLSYPPPQADFTINIERTMGGDLNVAMKLTGTGADTSRAVSFVRSIQKVHTLLYHPESGFLDSLVYTLASSFAEHDSTETMILEAQARWTNALGIPFDSLYTQTFITVRGGNTFAVEKGFSLPARTEKHNAVLALELKGWVENTTDSSVLFVALAERKRMIDSEYFPSSERLRVVITGEDGTTVWNSSAVQIFMQMTAPVDPKNNGEVRRYEMPWNGMDMQGKPVPPGTYNVLLMLPARPSPYSVVIPFHWKESHDK